MRDILLMGTARQKSTRIKNKMTRPFGDITLFKLYLEKLEQIKKQKHPFDDIILALNPSDKTLCQQAKTYDVKIQNRDYFSSSKATLPKDIYHYLENYKQDYVMWINGCFPFLQIDTIIKVANYFKEHKELNSLHCVKLKQNWFWNPKTNRPFNLEKTSDATTQQSLPIYESVHCFHIHNVKDLIQKNRYWDFKPNDPYLYKLEDSLEFLDIDTQTEFDICESVYNR